MPPSGSCPSVPCCPTAHQPRTHFDEEALDDLAASLKNHGMVQPIVARKVGDKFEIIAGERRWRAARKAGLAMVPVVLKEVPEDRLLEFALVENIQRQELNAIEEAKAYWQLGEHLRLTQEQVADRVGKSRPQVANTLRLLRLPLDHPGDWWPTGKVSTGHAKVLLGVEEARHPGAAGPGSGGQAALGPGPGGPPQAHGQGAARPRPGASIPRRSSSRPPPRS